MVDGDGDVGGAVFEGAVGDADFVFAGFGEGGGEGGGHLAFVGVAVVLVADADGFADAAGAPVAGVGAFGVVEHDAGEFDARVGEVPFEDLFVGEEALLKFAVGDVLDVALGVDGEAGGGGGGLAEDHEDGFHADAAVGDVGGGHGDGDEEVGGLGFFRDEGAVGDGVGAAGGDADVAFVLDVAFGGDVALGVVGVDGVGAHADGVGGGFLFAEFVFGHDEGADHAAGFADVELVGPVAVVGEFVFGEAPLVEFFTDVGGDAGVVGDEVHEALLVGAVFVDDFLAAFVGGVGVVVVVADVVEGEGAVVVGVGLPVGSGVELVEELAPAGVEDAEDEFVLGGVVAFGFGEGDAVFGGFGVAGAEAVGLDAVVALAFDAGVLGADASEHAAFGVAGDFVGADGLFEDAEVVAVVEDADLDAVVLLAIDAVGFPTDVEVDASGGHEVAFVGGVEEHFAGVGFAIEGGDGGDAGAVFFDAGGAVEEGLADDGDVEFFDPVVVDAFGDMRFEDPGALGGVVEGGVALAFVAVFGAFLLPPVFVSLVVEPGAVVELAGEAADDVFVAGVGPAEAAGGEAAEVFVRGDDDDGLAHLFGLDGGDDGGAGAAVDDEVVVLSGGGESEEEGEDEDAHGDGKEKGHPPGWWLPFWLIGNKNRSVLGADFFQDTTDVGGLIGGAGFGVMPDDFVAFDEEALAGGEADGGHAGDAEGFEDLAFGVGDEVEGKGVVGDEFLLGFGFVSGDAEDLDAFFGEVGEGITEGAGLFGAAGGVGFGVEEDDGGAFGVDVFEGDGFAVLIDAGDIGGGEADFFTFAAEEGKAGDGAEGEEDAGQHGFFGGRWGYLTETERPGMAAVSCLAPASVAFVCQRKTFLRPFRL